MPITVDDFKEAFPEFADAPPDLVTKHLTYAQTRTPPSVWGDFTEEGTFLWCARFLALDPFGRKMGVIDEKNGGTTAYDSRLSELLRAVSPRAVVL